MSVMSLEALAAVAESRKARIAEWNKYRANKPIDLDGVRAFNPEDPVPAGHVDGYDHEVQDQEYREVDGVWSHHGVEKDGKAVTHTEHVAPVIDRADVYEVGGDDDPNMPAKVEAPKPPKKPEA